MRAFHSRFGARAALERLAEMRERRLRERRNGGSAGQPRFCLVSRTSSAPSGEPCASNVSCLCGEP